MENIVPLKKLPYNLNTYFYNTSFILLLISMLIFSILRDGNNEDWRDMK